MSVLMKLRWPWAWPADGLVAAKLEERGSVLESQQVEVGMASGRVARPFRSPADGADGDPPPPGRLFAGHGAAGVLAEGQALKWSDKLNMLSTATIAAFTVVLAVVASFQLKQIVSNNVYTARSAQAAEDNAGAALAAANAADQTALAAMKQIQPLRESARAAEAAADAATAVLQQIQGAHLLTKTQTLSVLTDLMVGFDISVTNTGLSEATEITFAVDADVTVAGRKQSAALIRAQRDLKTLESTESHVFHIKQSDVSAGSLPGQDYGSIRIASRMTYTDAFGIRRERSFVQKYAFQPNGQLDLQPTIPQ